jgi:xylan 1,4-beta-xylosidase
MSGRREARRRQVPQLMTRLTMLMTRLYYVRLARSGVVLALAALSVLAALPAANAQSDAKSSAAGHAGAAIVVDLNASSHPFPHFWEQMYGSGRAVLSLRESYRDDLRDVKRVTGFQYIRFHGIFLDEVGLYDEDKDGKPVYNFSYVDQIYDGLLKNHVRPFVELSFMPNKLTSDPKAIQAFWYKPNVGPPKDWDKWGQLVEAFVRHLVQRYGEDEVAAWYFEVWNEPNLDFWAGEPRQSTYYQLYDQAAGAIKRVSARLRVGGPATAQAAWADSFLAHCKANNIPVDFVSTHVYGNDRAEDVFGTHEVIPRNQMVCRAVNKVHQQILASPYPQMPLIWSEFNADYSNQTQVTDSAYIGPWMADTIRQCDGLTQMMSYWDFSDVFEEQGVVKRPFYGGFGLLAENDLPKPSFNDFALLHKLGDVRLDLDSESALVTKRTDGAIVVAVWGKIVPPEEQPSGDDVVRLEFKGLAFKHSARVTVVDDDHGSPLPLYKKMGSPQFLTRSQIEELRAAASLPAAKTMPLQGSTLTLRLPSHALALVEIDR